MTRLVTGPGGVVSVAAVEIAAVALVAGGCWSVCWPVAGAVELGPVADALAGLVGTALAEPLVAPAGAGLVDVGPVAAKLAGKAEPAASAGAAVANTPTTIAAVKAAEIKRFTRSPPVTTDKAYA